MRIVSCLERNSDNKVTYSYFHRGTDIPYLPDRTPETDESNFYTQENGNLFEKAEVWWEKSVLLGDGIDIKFNLNDIHFIDHVDFYFGEGTALDSVEIFTIIDGRYKKIGRHEAETRGMITKEQLSVPIGFTCDNLVIRLNGCFMPIIIKRMDILGVRELENTIWPIPKNIKQEDKSFPLSNIGKINAIGEDAQLVREYLLEMLLEKYNYKPDEDAENEIVISLVPDIDKDGYSLETSDSGCYIKASGRRGLFYGACAFLQLLDEKNIKCAQIDDEPFMDIRGIHIALPPRNRIDFLKRLTKYLLVPMHYNTIFLQISGAMRYEKYPEINEKWIECCEKYENGQWPKIHHYGFIGRDILEKEEVSELCNFMREYGIEIIPEIQSWGHTQYITVAYPELAEKDETVLVDEETDLDIGDKKPTVFYPHTMCPQHDKYYDVIFGIIDEVVDAVCPERFVHIGHDEIYDTGLCSKCNQIHKDELFAEEVNRLYEYVQKKGLKMMMWADMLQDCMKYSIPDAIDKIPKDIVMADFVWYFHLDKDIEDRLLSYGFDVLMGNLYSSHYTRFENRSKKEGIIGGEVSVWQACDEKVYAYFGKMFDFVYTANMMWNKDYRSDMRTTYNEIIKKILGNMRLDIGGLRINGEKKSIDISMQAETLPIDLQNVTNYDCVLSISGAEEEKEVLTECNADIITFVHATDEKSYHPLLSDDAVKIAEYVLIYDDGTEYTEDISYAENIYYYRTPYGDIETSPLFRHGGYVGTYLCIPVCGKTIDGYDYTLGEYSIKNPYPDKNVQKIKIKHCKNTGAKILVFDIKFMKKVL